MQKNYAKALKIERLEQKLAVKEPESYLALLNLSTFHRVT